MWRGVGLSYSDQSLSLYFSADQLQPRLASLLDNVSVKLETGGDCAHLNRDFIDLMLLPNDLKGDSQSLENRDTKLMKFKAVRPCIEISI